MWPAGNFKFTNSLMKAASFLNIWQQTTFPRPTLLVLRPRLMLLFFNKLGNERNVCFVPFYLNTLKKLKDQQKICIGYETHLSISFTIFVQNIFPSYYYLANYVRDSCWNTNMRAVRFSPKPYFVGKFGKAPEHQSTWKSVQRFSGQTRLLQPFAVR